MPDEPAGAPLVNRSPLPYVVNGRFLRARPTGVHRVARSLLAAAREQGFDPPVLRPGGPAGEATGAGRVRRMSDQFWEQVVLPARARDARVLSLTNTGPVAARHGVVMIHDLAPLVGPHWFVDSMELYSRVVLAAGRRAERVLTVSQQVADELRERGVGAPISVIRQAVNEIEAATPEQVSAVCDRMRIRPPYLLLIGWADPRKDAVTAVTAHQRLVRSRPHTLVLAGLRHPVFAPVEVPDLPSVRTLDWVPDTDLAALLTGAEALVYPSRYEGFGRPALEAWRCGTPALVSDLPAMREATRDGAVFVPPGDVTAWADAMAAALDGQVAAPAPDPWTWADAARQLLAALRS